MKDEKTVESSNNLAFVREENGQLTLEISLRSSNHEKMGELKEELTEIIEKNIFSYKTGSEYPGWEYKEDSKLRPLAQKLYKKMTGENFETVVIHAGLECGALYEKYPEMDIISVGPNIRVAHSVKEKVEISSVERVYEFIKQLLMELK